MGMAEPPDYSQRLCFIVLACFQGSNNIKESQFKTSRGQNRRCDRNSKNGKIKVVGNLVSRNIVVS